MRHPVDGLTERFTADFSSRFPAAFVRLRLWASLATVLFLSGCATFAPTPPRIRAISARYFANSLVGTIMPGSQKTNGAHRLPPKCHLSSRNLRFAAMFALTANAT